MEAAEQRARPPSWLEFERHGWQQRAGAYHHFFAPVITQVAPTVLDAVAAGPRTRLLDACSGPGYLCGAAAARGGRAAGIDIAPSMARLASGLYPRSSFQVGDVCALPYAAASFDAVVCNLGIHHVADPAAAVAEFARVLAPGKLLAMTVWDDRSSQLAIVKDAVFAASPQAPPTLPSVPARPDYLSEREIDELLGPAGLRLSAVRPTTARYHVSDVQTLWDNWLATAIRTGPLLQAQPAQTRQAARETLDRLIEPHLGSDGSVSLSADLLLIVARTIGG